MATSNNVNRSHDQGSVSQRIRDIFESIMQLPSEESHLRFLEKRMEDVANEFKATLVSSSLGLDHPTAPYFRQLEDGFGHTLQRQKDFLEMMVTRKRSYTSSSSAYFPPPTHGTKRRETFDDVLDRAAKRDNERNPNK